MDIFLYIHLLPLDKLDCCTTGTHNVQPWVIKVTVNRFLFLINKLHFNEMMSLHSVTLFWFWANQSLLLLLNAAYLTEKRQIPIL